MKLTKEQVYINLKGKSKEELTELWEFLDKVGEKQFRDSLNDFLNNYYGWPAYEFSYNYWQFSSSRALNDKTEVTIEQLKEILQPMETLEQQLQKAEAEVKRLKEEIEADKIKCGDWYFEISNKVIRRAQNKMTKEHLFSNYNSIKITDQELINKLNELITNKK